MQNKSNMQNKSRSGNRKKSGSKKGRALFFAVIAAALAAIIVIVIVVKKSSGSSDETAYREVTATKGPLTVGISEDGTVEVGTTDQTFDLDISAYTGSTSTTTTATAGGMNMGGGGMPGMQSSSTSTSGTSTSERSLTVEEVLVSQGQEITEGDVIATLDAESVASILSDLTADVSNAQLSLEEATTSKSDTDGTATAQYQLYQTYGTYADAELASAVQDLQDAVDSAQQTVDDDTDSLAALQEDLSDDQNDLAETKTLLDNAQYAVDNTSSDGTGLYAWMTARNTLEDLQDQYDDLEDEIDDLNDQIDDMNSILETDQQTLTTAQKALSTGTIDAQTEYDTKMLYSESADSYYSNTTGQSNLNLEIAQDDYDTAVDKLDEFNSVIQDNQILSQYSGVIEDVSVSVGDALQTGTTLLSINNYDDIEISVDVSSDDISEISEGDTVNVSIDAYPDEEFTGTVDEIGDSTYDSSSGETTYAVTVLVDNTGSSLYNGMSSTVTFITKETQNVVYVSNRAITRENGVSYVLKKDENGNAVKTEVTTGFSDGTDVEIKEGLEDGDTVLIESKVSG